MKKQPDNICRICNKSFKNLSQHIRQTHKIDYKKYYDDYVLVDGEGLCLRCGNSTNFVSTMYGYHDYCSLKCSNNSEIVKLKKQKTSLKHFGVEHPNQSQQIRDKIKITLLKRYGVANPLQSEKIKQKSIETNLKRYGVKFSSQNPETRNKYRMTCIKKYGVDNPSKTFRFRLKCRDMLKKRIEKQTGHKMNPMKGTGEDSCFNELEKYISYQIQRNISKIRYFPDGYIEELRVVVEFDEKEHQTRTWYINHDRRRDLDFLKINHKTFRIKKIEWDKDPEYVISKFVNFIENIEASLS